MDIVRWFGVVRKRNGKYVFGHAPVSDFSDQNDFLRGKLKMEKGDVVIELLQNSLWQPKDFTHYCVETFFQKKPKATLERE